MTGLAVMSLVSGVAGAVGVLIAILALRESRRSARAAEASVAEARRSAAAAEASVTLAQRSAAASEASASASAVSADIDRETNRRARTPRLLVTLDVPAAHDGTDATYVVRNDGPADLDDVVVLRPLVDQGGGGVIYPVARLGGNYEDEVSLGPLPVTGATKFSLRLGAAGDLPAFHVRLRCTTDTDQWEVSAALEGPRKPKPGVPVVVFAPDPAPSVRDMNF